jgi:hypothetical protein
MGYEFHIFESSIPFQVASWTRQFQTSNIKHSIQQKYHRRILRKLVHWME